MRYVILAVICLLVAGCANTLVSNTKNHDFKEVLIGESATSGTIYWRNTGNDTVHVTSVVGAANPFSLQPLAFPAETLNAGERTAPVQGVFAPSAVGPFNTSIVAVANAGGIPVTADAVKLKGVGIAQFSTSDFIVGVPVTVGGAVGPVDFGSVVINTRPGPIKTVQLQNTTMDPVSVMVRPLNGGRGFIVNEPVIPVVVRPLGRIDAKIEFSPSSVGKVYEVIVFEKIGATMDIRERIGATSVTGEGIAPVDPPPEDE